VIGDDFHGDAHEAAWREVAVVRLAKEGRVLQQASPFGGGEAK
jgi:hypothetical protein